MAAASWIKSHPGKGIWTFAAILFNAIRFPLWLIYFLPSFTRQSSKWSLRKSEAKVVSILRNLASDFHRQPFTTVRLGGKLSIDAVDAVCYTDTYIC
jgi:hypothetical protein